MPGIPSKACSRQCTGLSVDDRYSFEGVLQAVYGFDRADLDCSSEVPHECNFRDPEKFLKSLDVSHAKFYIDFIVLCGIFAGLRVCCYLILRWRVKVH